MDPEFEKWLQEYYAQNPDSTFGKLKGAMGTGGGDMNLSSLLSLLKSGNPVLGIASGALSAVSGLLGGKSPAEKATEWSLEQRKRLTSRFGNELRTGGDVIDRNKILGMLDEYRVGAMPGNARMAAGMARQGITGPAGANLMYRNQLAPEADYMRGMQEKNIMLTAQHKAELQRLLAQLAGG